MGSVRVYRHSDVGAPSHPNATRGSMINLLRKCLIEGYGYGEDWTVPAGWEEPYPESNYTACFRATSGARQFYQIREDSAYDADVSYIRACESMSDAETISGGQWGEDYFGKHYPGYSGTNGWTVIADDKTCYVILTGYAHSSYNTGNGSNVIHGFGEYDSLIPDDPYNSFVSGHQTNTALPSNDYQIGLHYATFPSTSSGYGLEIHKSIVGTLAGNATLVSNAGGSHTLGCNTYLSTPGSAGVGLGWYFNPLYITCDSDQTSSLKLISGKLRGFYEPLAHKPLSHNETFVDDTTGKTFMMVYFSSYPSSSSARGSVVFDISGAW